MLIVKKRTTINWNNRDFSKPSIWSVPLKTPWSHNISLYPSILTRILTPYAYSWTCKTEGRAKWWGGGDRDWALDQCSHFATVWDKFKVHHQIMMHFLDGTVGGMEIRDGCLNSAIIRTIKLRLHLQELSKAKIVSNRTLVFQRICSKKWQTNQKQWKKRIFFLSRTAVKSAVFYVGKS